MKILLDFFLVLYIFVINDVVSYEEGPWKGPGPPLLMVADLIHKPPASNRFAPMKHALAVTVEPFKFSPAEPVAYELSYVKLLLVISNLLIVLI